MNSGSNRNNREKERKSSNTGKIINLSIKKGTIWPKIKIRTDRTMRIVEIINKIAKPRITQRQKRTGIARDRAGIARDRAGIARDKWDDW